MKEIVKKMPDYDFVYLGDTARVPYGTRSTEIIYGFVCQAVNFFFKKKCALIIFACNTASSDALRRIQKEYISSNYASTKVLGVLIPAAEEAVQKTKNKKIGIIATSGTVASGAFKREIKKINPEIKIFQQACPLLVPLIEAGEQNSKPAEMILKNYLRPLIDKKIDTLVLGCTHYGIIENKIKKIVGKKVRVVAEPMVVAKKLKNYLKRHPEIEKKLSKKGSLRFYSTDITDNFKILGKKFFGRKIEVQKVEL